MNDIQKLFHNLLIEIIVKKDYFLEVDIDKSILELCSMPMFSVLTEDQIEEVRNLIKTERSIKLDKGSLIEEKHHERWFLNRKATLEMKYWERYKLYLKNVKHFSPSVINSMDDILDTQVDLLGDPTRDISYKRRGLIIGDVQSGKTANYIGLICKAVDAGYKVIVLMTGTLEKLRRQTQQRIDEGFVGADSNAMMKQCEDGQLIGVGLYDSSIRPMVLTSTSDDFKAQNAKNLNFDLKTINGSVIFVVKKNVAILKRLNKWLRTFNQNGQQQIEHSVLVIDDEADNASVNTNPEDRDPTAINLQIRDTLKMFSKSSYVGFTATPFANIFIDPESNDSMMREDLFPKDYIYSLNAPSNYIGARDIFGKTATYGEMLVRINDNAMDLDTIENYIPLKHKSDYYVKEIPRDMEVAIESFVIANAIRDYRQHNGTHRSMLINVSRFTNVQNQVYEHVNSYVKRIQASCRLYSAITWDEAIKDIYMKRLFETFKLVFYNVDLSWEDIHPILYTSCASIKVATVNQQSGQNLNYDDYEKDGLRLIAIGGLSLSRGLTLEGLMTSYFYRNSKMYDTLMQMGRWFGYRAGYEDICRIWMCDDSIEWYRHISEATDELREEVRKYEDSDLTPLDFGLRVRSDVNTLLVTARNKMRSATSVECAISLSEVCIETPELYSDKNKNLLNLRAVEFLSKTLISDGYTIEQERKTYGFKNIPVKYILSLLEDLDISPKNEEFSGSSLIEFIKNYNGIELRNWDIAFATGNSNKEKIIADKIIKYPKRSYSIENNGKIIKMSASKRRLGTISDGKFGLDNNQIKDVEIRKNNVSQKDYFINVRRNPLLTIYFVELLECKPVNEFTQKIEEDFKDTPLVGIGIGIPKLTNEETKYAKYVINKIEAQKIFDQEFDISEEE